MNLDSLLIVGLIQRNCRGEKIIWQDVDGNNVDFDFVLELDGTTNKRGIPIAFFETFWRRGSRHSKDKARDDSGKLMPMKDTFPTARVLGIISAGDFTNPAKELVKSRGIDLFYVEKNKIISAWQKHDLVIDYHDKSSEEIKNQISSDIIDSINVDINLLNNVANTLMEIVGQQAIKSYIQRLVSQIGAVPQKYIIEIQSKTDGFTFNSYKGVDEFLIDEEPDIRKFDQHQYYGYSVEFYDGDVFNRENLSWQELKQLHSELKYLISYMELK